ncbi:MAG: T9SS type A sorting domain-containing protein [Flavobacteriales bacterium]|jgi:hypothetical protein|nr:T9SS type A sorting domain-containing protein [Flavobacteriales bacterium]
MKRALLFPLIVAFYGCGFGQSTSPSNAKAVRVMATIPSGETSIMLKWNDYAGSTGYSIYRRANGATNWGSVIADLPGTALSFTDATVQVGSAYEYRVVRSGGGSAYGYIRSGIRVPEIAYRGQLILLVESSAAASLVSELAEVEEDLLADGWIVKRHDVLSSASVNSVRTLVRTDYNAAPTEVKAVYVIGHVPVPYSGSVNPDGHPEHRGAWPCDGYYGEMNGTWTDNSVNTAASNFSWNHNVPGDGKFDQSDFPSAVELQVGRVDFDDMPSFPEGELNMLRGYFAKAHEWKTGEFTVPTRASVWDDLQWVSDPLSMSGYQSSAACVGLDSITELSIANGPYVQHYLNHDELIMYQSGTGLQLPGPGGTVLAGTTNGLSSFDMVNNSHGAVFNMSLGSYFGDWDNSDNFLRAVLVRGNGLAHVWSGMPNWYLHPLAMGEPIGYCALRSMNNSNQDYTLQNGGWQGQSLGRVQMGLMGDPTVRMFYTAPPTDLVVSNDQWYSTFSWQPSPVEVDGYHVYRIDEVNDTIVQLTDTLVTGTTFTATEQYMANTRYMVRALKLVTTASGSYFDLSLGAIALGTGVEIADCENVIGGGALPGTPCDDGDEATLDDVYSETCECAGTLVGIDEYLAVGSAIWPSPADEVLYIRTKEIGGVIQIRSLTGALVISRTMLNTNEQVDTSSLVPGTYVLEYKPADQHALRSVHRFVVQH